MGDVVPHRRRNTYLAAAAALAQGVRHAYNNREWARERVAEAREVIAGMKRRYSKYRSSSRPAKRRRNGPPPSAPNGRLYNTKYSRPRTVYRKRRIRKGRRGRKSFYRKWRKALMRELGSQDFIVTGNQSFVKAASDRALITSLAFCHGDDIKEIVSKAIGTSLRWNQKVYLQKSYMDITLYNNQNVLQFLEVYEVVARKDIAYQDGGSIQTFLSYYHQKFLVDSEMPSPDMQGLTPFHSHDFCEHFLIRRVQNLAMEGNTGARLKLKGRTGRLDASDWNIAEEGMEVNGQPIDDPAKLFARKGWTAGFVFIMRGHPTASVSSLPLNTMRLDVAWVKNFTVKVLEQNTRAMFYKHSEITYPEASEQWDQEENFEVVV